MTAAAPTPRQCYYRARQIAAEKTSSFTQRADATRTAQEKRSEALAVMTAIADAAREELGLTDEVTLRIMCVLEELRSHPSLRDASESAHAFAELQLLVEEALPIVHPVSFSVRGNRAKYTLKAGRVDEAVQMRREELLRSEKHFGQDAYRTCMRRMNLTVALRQTGRDANLNQARRLIEEEISIRREHFGADSAFTWVAEANMLDMLVDEAQAGLRRREPPSAQDLAVMRDLAVDGATKKVKRFGPQGGPAKTARRRLAEVLMLQGDFPQARWILQQVAAAESVSGTDTPGVTQYLLAANLAASGDDADGAEAIRLLQAAEPHLRAAGSKYLPRAEQLLHQLRDRPGTAG